MAQFQGPPMYRPFKPGERRQNADGSYSTEITTTWQQPDGQWLNAPSLWMGPKGPTQFDAGDEDSILGALRNYEQSQGPYVQRFPSLQEAETAAVAKSKAGGAGAPMAGPWERYQQQAAPQQPAAGPWTKFQQTAPEPQIEQPPALGGAAQEFADFASQATQNPARAQYDQLPGWQKPIVAANDILQTVANGATFGFGDKAVAAARAPFTGQSYDEELAAARSKTQGARNRAGGAGTTGEIAGAVAAPLAMANKGLTMAGRGGTAAMEGIKGLLARSGLMAAEGAGYGTLNAAGNDTDLGTGAAIGALGGGAGNIVGEGLAAGAGKIAGMFNKKPVIPQLENLRALADQAYKKADEAGVVFSPQGMNKVRTGIVNEFADRGFLPANEPGAAAVLGELDKVFKGNVTLKGLDTIRKMAGNAYIPGNNSNNALTRIIVDKIDDLVTSPGADDVLMGDGQGGAAAISQARNLWSRIRKMETVNDAVEKASLRAASTGSGGNADNATRQNLRRVLEKGRGFSPDEKVALEAAVRGTPGQNALRLAGKLSPSGNGLMAALGVGGTMVNPMVGVASLGGMGAKALADNMTGKSVQSLSDIIAAGGQKSATQAAPNAVQRLAETKRDALARALMAIIAQQGAAPGRP